VQLVSSITFSCYISAGLTFVRRSFSKLSYFTLSKAYFTLSVALYLQVPIHDEVGLNLKYKHFKRQLILASVDPELEASGALSPRNSLRFGA